MTAECPWCGGRGCYACNPDPKRLQRGTSAFKARFAAAVEKHAPKRANEALEEVRGCN